MCFILNIFNSCKTSAKKSSRKSSIDTNNASHIDISNRHYHTKFHTSINSIKSIKSLNEYYKSDTKNQSVYSFYIENNKKSPFEQRHNLAEFDSDDIEFDNIPSPDADVLKEKLLNRSKADFQLKLVSKLEKSNSLTNSISKYSNIKKIIRQEHQILANLKYKNISDYCNECGYYCCECELVTNSESRSSQLSLNKINFYADEKPNKENSLNEDDFYKEYYFETKKSIPITQPSINQSNNLDNSLKNEYQSADLSTRSFYSTSKILVNQFNESMTSLNQKGSLENNLNIVNKNFNHLNVGNLNNGFESQVLKKHIPNDLNGSGSNNSINNTNFELNDNTDSNRNLMNARANLTIRNVPKRPMMGMTSIQKKHTGGRLLEQPQLGLEKINMKKNKFFFAKDELFAKPQDDDDLSRELEKQKKDIYNRQHKMKQNKGGKISISSNQIFEFKESDLKELGQIGNGEFGTVHKALHTPSQTLMAIKRIGPTVGNQVERKKVLKELDFVLECNENEFVVKFYGVKFNNEPADCLICMELMDTSLEKFYKFVYGVKNEEIPEKILGKVVVATVSALDYLREKHSIIHRDVKPSNMLVNKQGEIKMCDFGISGKLVDSIAASRDAGCQLYMAPERIDPSRAGPCHGYDVRSDIWSLGISMYELATGKFPYPSWTNIFNQLSLVVQGDAPRLKSDRLTDDFCNFVNTCLTKDEKKRPKYKQLKDHALFYTHSRSSINVSDYIAPYISEMFSNDNTKT